ncbi:MAG TPA: hypothetical protein VFS60_07560 [Thermoanaerobaculia bacterium]|nr:hypothetical protein [Thermoanaerobaculia bacterium]
MDLTRVHVIVSGIVSLIPIKDKGWCIRLQDARTVSDGLEPHQATILADAALASVRDKDGAVRAPDKSDGRLAVWKVGYGPIEVLTPPAGPKLAHDAKIHNLLRIADAFGDSTKAVANSAYPAADLTVSTGVIASTGMEPKSWRYKGAEEEKAQWIAEEACWGFGVTNAQRQVQLRFQDLDDKDKKWTLTVEHPKEGGPIELRLQNVPYEDSIPTFEGCHRGHHSVTAAYETDKHTALYFKQCPNSPGVGPELVSDGNPKAKPSIDTHQHRLAARKIATDRRPVGVKAEEFRSIRINCPPAVWYGFY